MPTTASPTNCRKLHKAIDVVMPPQLANAKRRHDRHSESRPIVELTAYVDVNELRHIIPRDYSSNIYSNGFRYPFAKNLILSGQNIKFCLHSGYNQRVEIHWVKTGFGKPRPLFICQCGYGACRLFFRHGCLACRFCHRALYASQKYDQIGRKRLAAAKLRLTQLGGLPNSNEPIPPKPKWTRRRTYQRIRNEIQALEANAKTRPFKKPLSPQLFAYHIG